MYRDHVTWFSVEQEAQKTTQKGERWSQKREAFNKQDWGQRREG